MSAVGSWIGFAWCLFVRMDLSVSSRSRSWSELPERMGPKRTSTCRQNDSLDLVPPPGLQGLKYAVYFYGCKEAMNCSSIQFFAGYTDPFTIEKANEWNKTYRWVRAYEGEGSNFKMDVDFAGGITRDHLEEVFVTWETLASKIKDFVGDN
jgi:hypothetical protein